MTLTPLEKEIILAYRQLDTGGKAAIRGALGISQGEERQDPAPVVSLSERLREAKRSGE